MAPLTKEEAIARRAVIFRTVWGPIAERQLERERKEAEAMTHLTKEDEAEYLRLSENVRRKTTAISLTTTMPLDTTAPPPSPASAEDMRRRSRELQAAQAELEAFKKAHGMMGT
jgi:hypothetical protein